MVKLPRRETQVLVYASYGHTNPTIGAEFGISIGLINRTLTRVSTSSERSTGPPRSLSHCGPATSPDPPQHGTPGHNGRGAIALRRQNRSSAGTTVSCWNVTRCST
jgi:hypothetical protein